MSRHRSREPGIEIARMSYEAVEQGVVRTHQEIHDTARLPMGRARHHSTEILRSITDTRRGSRREDSRARYDAGKVWSTKRSISSGFDPAKPSGRSARSCWGPPCEASSKVREPAPQRAGGAPKVMVSFAGWAPGGDSSRGTPRSSTTERADGAGFRSTPPPRDIHRPPPGCGGRGSPAEGPQKP